MARILIVDDEEYNVILLCRRLKKIGYEVMEARNGADALGLLHKESFDLILLDIMMPVMDGFEVAAIISKDPELSKIPIIFLSAKASVESKLKGLELGAEEYITKPFDFRELQVRIKMVLQKNQEKNSLKQAAVTDFLTGLNNRRYIDELLGNIFNNADIDKASLLMMDLDRFKRINDTYGHDHGDEVLKKTAEMIRRSVNNSAVIGRYGGEEFLAILLNTEKEEALNIAEKIRSTMSNNEFILDGKKEHITISIGISILIKSERKYGTTNQWLQTADTALYKAKNLGRNCVIILDES
jgi:two-component system, cell cycle response regulator